MSRCDLIRRNIVSKLPATALENEIVVQSPILPLGLYARLSVMKL